MDTSALLAALVADHEHHELARARLRPGLRITAIVLAEAFSALRRSFGQPATAAAALLAPWTAEGGGVLPTTERAVIDTFRRAAELDLGGSIHDALIARVCAEFGVPLLTLDARQHQLALALGADSTYLLA